MSVRPLKLLSSMATRELLAELADDYAHRSGRPVAAEAAGGVDVAKRVEAGEAVDIVVLARNAIDKLIGAGRLIAGSRVDLVRSGVSVAVRAGAPKPDIGSEEAVKRAVLAAQSLSYSTGPSGVHLEQLFARWGILERIRARIVVPKPGIPVGSLVASGEAQLGFQQLSELMRLPGVEVLGPLPAGIQAITIFSGGIGSRSDDPQARSLLEFLGSADTAAIKQRHGMEAAD
ncbi:MAG: substrate-binding domain-containing protein [Steroidobacteraceae bacterium]